MPATSTPRAIMAALIDDKPVPRTSVHVLVGYADSPLECDRVPRLSIFSYGPHFPMAIRGQDEDVWFVHMGRYSTTTSAHQRGVRDALTDAGFTLNEENPEIVRDRDGRFFARYARGRD